MSRSGTRTQNAGANSGQPSVEEMLVSIRKAIHGDNAKAASKNNSNKTAAKPVSGSMRQTRISLTGTVPNNVSPKASPTAQASVRTHSDNFQKLKKQLHELDPLLGRQGKQRVAQDRARSNTHGSANGFAGILNGDIKLEEALAKLERAGLGQAPIEQIEPQNAPSNVERQRLSDPQPEPSQMRGTELDDFDEYDFDHQTYGVESQSPVQETYLESPSVPDLRQSDYSDHEPSYIQRAQEPAVSPPPQALPQAAPLPVAPPVATAPLAPPPAPRQPSYGYVEEPQRNEQQSAPQTYDETYAEPAVTSHPQVPHTPIQQTMPQVLANQELSPRSTGLTSPQNAQAASDAFATLAETIMHQASVGNRSIDQLTKELLHPMLRGWLDENLPGMVERLIREEIERVARGGFRP